MSPDRPRRGSLASLQPAASQAPPLPARPAPAPPAKPQTPEVRSTEVQTPGARKPPARRRAGDRAQARRGPGTPEVQTPGLPKYLRLERKELLLWPEQVTRLSIQARALNRTRRGQGERITVNTLIRVAVALLLSRSQDLAGTTEEELRRSLGLPD